jgi:hypothetical protein
MLDKRRLMDVPEINEGGGENLPPGQRLRGASDANFS